MDVDADMDVDMDMDLDLNYMSRSAVWPRSSQVSVQHGIFTEHEASGSRNGGNIHELNELYLQLGSGMNTEVPTAPYGNIANDLDITVPLSFSRLQVPDYFGSENLGSPRLRPVTPFIQGPEPTQCCRQPYATVSSPFPSSPGSLFDGGSVEDTASSATSQAGSYKRESMPTFTFSDQDLQKGQHVQPCTDFQQESMNPFMTIERPRLPYATLNGERSRSRRTSIHKPSSRRSSVARNRIASTVRELPEAALSLLMTDHADRELWKAGVEPQQAMYGSVDSFSATRGPSQGFMNVVNDARSNESSRTPQISFSDWSAMPMIPLRGSSLNSEDLSASSITNMSRATTPYAASDSDATLMAASYQEGSDSQLLVCLPQERRGSCPLPLHPDALSPHTANWPGSAQSAVSSRSTSPSPSFSGYYDTPVLGQQIGRSVHSLGRSSKKGRRHGPLTPEKRRQVQRARDGKYVCIGCKRSKTECCMPSDGSNVCQRCQKATNSDKIPRLCVPVYFTQHVKQGSTNLIAQFSINHIRKDLGYRRRLAMPRTLRIAQLCDTLEYISQNFDVGVSQGDVLLYDLNLERCAEYLGVLRTMVQPESSFQTFINTHVQMGDGWQACIQGTDPLQDLTGNLAIWNNMPSRVTYSLIAKSDGQRRILDPDSVEDQPLIIAAAQMGRIISRRLELAGFDKLEDDLIKNHNSLALCTRLAHILLSLRWRLSWWALLGSGVPRGELTAYAADVERLEARKRVSQICLVLYIQYLFCKRRLPHTADKSGLHVKTSRYADSMCQVTEAFPHDESEEGFQRWMMVGIEKIREARISDQLRLVGLESGTEIDAVIDEDVERWFVQDLGQLRQ